MPVAGRMPFWALSQTRDNHYLKALTIHFEARIDECGEKRQGAKDVEQKQVVLQLPEMMKNYIKVIGTKLPLEIQFFYVLHICSSYSPYLKLVLSSPLYPLQRGLDICHWLWINTTVLLFKGLWSYMLSYIQTLILKLY